MNSTRRRDKNLFAFPRFPRDSLGDGRGWDPGFSFAAHQVGRIEEMSEEEEVGGVHQRAVLKVIPRLIAEVPPCLYLR